MAHWEILVYSTGHFALYLISSFFPLHIRIEPDSGKQAWAVLKLSEKCVCDSTWQHRNMAVRTTPCFDDKTESQEKQRKNFGGMWKVAFT